MSAFYNGTILINISANIQNITILANTTEIQGGTTRTNSAFYEAKDSIENVYFEDGCHIENIPSYCFRDCSKLITVDLSTCSHLTTLKGYAFYYCDSLENIILPNSLTTLEPYTFFRCQSLNSLIIPKSVKPFSYPIIVFSIIQSLSFEEGTTITSLKNLIKASSIHSFKIPSSLQTFEGNYLEDWDIQTITIDPTNNFLSVNDNVVFSKDGSILYYFPCGRTGGYTIPNTVETLYQYSFYYSNLQEIIISDNVTNIPDYCFSNATISNFTLPQNIKSIGTNSFAYNHKLESVSLPPAVEQIGENCFSGCEKLVFIDFSPLCKNISESTFSYCISLESFTIPEGVETIERNAFLKCKSLSRVYLPSTIKYIISPFDSCSPNLELYKSNKLTSFISKDNLLFYDNNSTIIQEVVSQQEYFIPSSVKVISGYAFYSNPHLKSITFENSNNIEYIGSYAFNGCGGLKYFIFLDNGFFGSHGLFIGDNAFRGSRSLELNLTFSQTSNSILHICEYAFQNCKHIHSLSILQDSNCSLILDPLSFSYLGENFHSIYISQEANSSISISESAFGNTQSITDISIKQASYCSLSFVKGTFSLCDLLEKISIQQGKYSNIILASECFHSCNVLESVSFSQDDYSSIVFPSSPFGSNNIKCLSFHQKKNCMLNIAKLYKDHFKALSRIEFYQGDNSSLILNEDVFEDFVHLKSVHLSKCIDVIPKHAFDSCSSLETILIPSSCKIIDSYAFYKCSSLKQINIPISVSQVGSSAFSLCNNLEPCLIIENTDKEFRNNLITKSRMPERCVCESIPIKENCFTSRIIYINRSFYESSKLCYFVTFILSKYN